MYRAQSEKEMKSLRNHLEEIKKQYDTALKSEEMARVSEMKYRELVLQKQNVAKLTTNIDHLWEVKEIEYSNLMKVF